MASTAAADSKNGPQKFSSERLLALVECNPVIWDKRLPKYRCRNSKGMAWARICSELDKSFNNLKAEEKVSAMSVTMKKWYNIRDHYRKTMKHGKSKYVYSENLKFLDQVYDGTEAVDRSAVADEDYFFHEDDDDGETGVDVSDPSDVFANIEVISEPPTKTRKVDDPNAATAANESLVRLVTDIIRKEEDEDGAFFKSILPTVKNLPNDAKLEFRIEVMQMLQKLTRKYKNVRKMKTEIGDVDDDDESYFES